MGVRKGLRKNNVYGATHHLWKGGRYTDKGGYIRVMDRDNPSADRDGYVKEHILVATKALGRPLAHGEVVHHVDGDKTNNVNPNLVICSTKMHALIHTRMRAISGCGDVNKHKCYVCGEWKEWSEFSSKHHACKPCRRKQYAESKGGKNAA